MSEGIDLNEDKISLLQLYFSRNGLLFCNGSKDLPGIYSVGGDWNSIVALMECGEVFYSKLYKNRTSYLSRELYYQIKPFRHRVKNLSVKSKQIYEFIEAADLTGTQEIKNALMMSSKEFAACMNELHKELFVTAIKRERTLNENWCSFYWGTYHCWEQLKPYVGAEPKLETISALLSKIMTDKQVQSLLK